jgi:hypothetical protein
MRSAARTRKSFSLSSSRSAVDIGKRVNLMARAIHLHPKTRWSKCDPLQKVLTGRHDIAKAPHWMSHAGHRSFSTRIDNISISAVSDEEVSEIIESCRREERPALRDGQSVLRALCARLVVESIAIADTLESEPGNRWNNFCQMRLLTKNLRLKCVERKDPNASAANSGTVIMRSPLHAVSSKIFAAAQSCTSQEDWRQWSVQLSDKRSPGTS